MLQAVDVVQVGKQVGLHVLDHKFWVLSPFYTILDYPMSDSCRLVFLLAVVLAWHRAVDRKYGITLLRRLLGLGPAPIAQMHRSSDVLAESFDSAAIAVGP